MNKKYNVIYADPPWYFKNLVKKVLEEMLFHITIACQLKILKI